MRARWISVLVLVAACWAQEATVANPGMRTTFRVRYVAEGVVYLDGGRSAGLAEGTALVIPGVPKPKPEAAKPKDATSDTSGPAASASTDTDTDAGSAAEPEVPPVAQCKIVSLAETSAVCEVSSTTRTLVEGDQFSLPQQEVAELVEKRALSNTREYPAIVSFTEGDPLDEEAREEVPRPPLPEINMARGRIGFDYSGMSGNGGSSSSNIGFVIRADITRIYGTYWNVSGYWRGAINSHGSTAQPTIQDLINRTYHLSATYANPNSHWVAGLGRMYLPWATSLDTIDGGYFGRKLGKNSVVGLFGGSTPDPTSWSYDVNRRVAGTFFNVTGGDYDATHYSSTFGVGVSSIKWTIDRPFVFAENTVSYKRVFSLYDAMQIDRPHTGPGVTPVPAGLSRNILTVTITPNPKFSIDFNHTYFRDVPTYDPQLVGTGLLDKYLFQGFNVGARVALPYHLRFYTNIGRSDRSGDPKGSWNTLFGITETRIWRTGLQADFRYSKFDSAFAQGSYRSFTLSRNLGERFRGEVQIGEQRFISPVTKDTGSRFLNAHIDTDLGPHYFIEGGFTIQHGALQNYRQWYTTFGYRFDNRQRKKAEAARAAQQP